MNDETLKQGGPAFPCETDNTFYHGMTLRDWFAGQAAEDDILQYLPLTRGLAAEFKTTNGFEATREWARYQYADAMLKARETTP